ncbi:hypothetical protein [Actinomadura kijaniata]|uniref:hypothetical protein n=1 Tax=Actinomadura kijaniata TaxID=46161 RepID=UPI00082F3F5B|nr:hypothetical protein [Actinomadura kijaniata]
MTNNSLKDFLQRYADGQISREQMLDTIATWPLEDVEFVPGHDLPTHQDNTTEVLHEARLLRQITEEDYEEIWRRRRDSH